MTVDDRVRASSACGVGRVVAIGLMDMLLWRVGISATGDDIGRGLGGRGPTGDGVRDRDTNVGESVPIAGEGDLEGGRGASRLLCSRPRRIAVSISSLLERFWVGDLYCLVMTFPDR